MKIAQVSATFPPYMGGTGGVCYHYAAELAGLGHEVSVFSSNYPDLPCSYPASFKVNRMAPLFKIGNAPFIPDLWRLKDFDMIHLHVPFIFGDFLVRLVSLFRGIPYLVTYHNDIILDGLSGSAASLYEHTFQHHTLMKAKRICVTSFDYAENSKIKGIIGRRREDTIEVPNGVDTDRFSPLIAPGDIREKLGIEEKFVILFVGGLDRAHYFKGIEILLRSFSRLSDDDSSLLIIGDGDLKESYISLASDLGISQRTHFAGRISEQDLPGCYAAADMAVLPSITRGEAFGIVLLEAMATGKPVIASNLPGVRTVVDDGTNGFLIKPGSVSDLAARMRYLHDNEEICRRFGQEGREKVLRKYSWKQIGIRLDQCYSGVIS